jgi:hypothetical protein
MSKAKTPHGAAQPLPGTAKKGRKPAAPFDLWLQKGLHQLYDKVASEPIPDDLLKLIEEDRKR